MIRLASPTNIGIRSRVSDKFYSVADPGSLDPYKKIYGSGSESDLVNVKATSNIFLLLRSVKKKY